VETEPSLSRFPQGTHVVVFEPTGLDAGASTVTVTQNPKKHPLQPLPAAPQPAGGGRTEQGAGAIRRVHVSIAEAKSLPQSVRFVGSQAEHGATYAWEAAGSPGGSLAAWHSTDDNDHGPTTFFTVEDFTTAASATTPSLLSSNAAAGKRSSAATGPSVGAWTVEAAVQGAHDRTRIICGSRSPQYRYECIANLPNAADVPLGQLQLHLWVVGDEASLRSRRVLSGSHHGTEEGGAAALGGGEQPPPLSPRSGSSSATAAGRIVQLAEDQLDDLSSRFWGACGLAGRVDVDLTMLKYLPVVDGWHKVVSVLHSVETVIGHVRVAVRIL
jgi:hypothetical protein